LNKSNHIDYNLNFLLLDKLNKNQDYTLITFIPYDEPKLALDFYAQHIKVLQDYNIASVAGNPNWLNSRNVICFCLQDQNKKLVCGLRFHIKGNDLLPLQVSLKEKSTMLNEIIESKEKIGKIAEMCNLWVDRKYIKKGLPKLLSELSITEIRKSTDIMFLLNFYSNFTKDLVENLGFKQITNLENNGVFLYPNEKYLSFVGIQQLDNV
jgi:hypothetical protein